MLESYKPADKSSAPRTSCATSLFLFFFLAALALHCGTQASLVVAHRLSICDMQAQELWHEGLAAPRHVES